MNIKFKSDLKIYLLIVAPLLALIFYSCRVQYVASYDQVVQDEIIRIASEVDMFYGKLLETPDTNRTYDNFKDDYLKIEVDLRTLLTRNKIRPLNDESTKQTEIALKLWQDDKEKHKQKDTVGDFIINLHRNQFQRIFIAMAIGESAKEDSNNTNNQ